MSEKIDRNRLFKDRLMAAARREAKSQKTIRFTHQLDARGLVIRGVYNPRLQGDYFRGKKMITWRELSMARVDPIEAAERVLTDELSAEAEGAG